MGLFDWLFGPAKSAEPQWRLSENGNQTITIDGYRATVFKQDGGWKYVFGEEGDEDKAFFSDKFKTQREAMNAAMEEFD